jgi:hypothetical protein
MDWGVRLRCVDVIPLLADSIAEVKDWGVSLR